MVLEVAHVPCDSKSNKNKLDPRILRIVLPDRKEKYFLCRLGDNVS